MCQNLRLVLLLLYNLTSGNKVTTCGEPFLNNTSGIIRFSASTAEALHCNWTIVAPEKSITSIRVVKSVLVEDGGALSSLCLTIKGLLKSYLETCSAKIIKSSKLSVREKEIAVVVESVDSHPTLWLSFSSRKETECPNSDFQCLDKSTCFNASDIRSEEVICKDHSVEFGSGDCVPCDHDSEVCFDISQRCDGVVHCPSGEDELNCSSLCSNLIKCPDEVKCINKSQICDRSIDCADRFDEKNCQYARNSSKIFIVTTVFVVLSLCSIIFVCLIFRWAVTKRDVNRYLRNLPEIPLAPFQGPGEDDSDSDSSDPLEAEFRQGGEIYEYYMQSLKKKRYSSKAVQVGELVPKFSHLELDGDNEIVVLASLNVRADMCVGLTISESSIESIKTLKSARKSNDSDSSCGANGSLDLEGRAAPCSVRSRSGSKVKVALRLDDKPDVRFSKVSLEEFSRPKTNIAGGDFFIMTKANRISEVSFASDSENIPERHEMRELSLRKKRSAPLPCGVDKTPMVPSSRSLDNFPELVTLSDMPCRKERMHSKSDSSQWTDFEECDNNKPLAECRVEVVGKKTKVPKLSSKKKLCEKNPTRI